MGAGAVVAAAAAARAKRMRTIVDAFRVAGATAPDRARSLENLGLERNGEVEEFVREGVLVPAANGGSWYLSEAAYIARRDDGRGKRARMIVLLVAIGVALIAFGAAYAVRG